LTPQNFSRAGFPVLEIRVRKKQFTGSWLHPVRPSYYTGLGSDDFPMDDIDAATTVGATSYDRVPFGMS
jgi:hypothetical protein